MKKLILALLSAALIFGATARLAAADSAPKTVIHVVTVAFKEGTTPEQIQAVLDGAQNLTKTYPGITRVWVKTLKVQNPRGTEVPRTHVIAMEFASEKALAEYADSDAQKKWYETYVPIRAQSSSFDVTN